MEDKYCPICHKNLLKIHNGKHTKTCILCCSKRSSKYVKKSYENECIKCKKLFTSNVSNAKYCYNPCTFRKTETELWLSKKENARKFKRVVAGYKI